MKKRLIGIYKIVYNSSDNMNDIERLLCHSKWIEDIGKYIHQDDNVDIIKFALSYTLQSLKAKEDINRFKWNE